MQNIQQSGPPNETLSTVGNILSSVFISPALAGAKILRKYINKSKFNNYKPTNYNYNQIENIAQAYGLDTAGIYNIQNIVTNPEFRDNLTPDSYDFIEKNMPETNKAINDEEYDLDRLFKEYLDIKSSSYGNNWTPKEDMKEYNRFTTGFESNLGGAAWDSFDTFIMKPLEAIESIGKMPFNLVKQGVKYLNGKQNDPEFFSKLGNFYKALITGEEVEGKDYTQWYLDTGFDNVLPKEWRNSSKGVDILNYVLSELLDVSNYLTFGTGLIAKGGAKGAKLAIKEATKLGSKEAAKIGSKEATKLGTKEIAEKSGEEIGKRLLSKASMRQLGIDAGHAAFGGAIAGTSVAYDLNPFLTLGLSFLANPAEDIVRSIYKKRKMNFQNSNLDNIKRSNYVERNPSSVSYSTVKKPITQTATKKPIRNNNTTAEFIQTNTEVPLVRFSGEDDLSAIDNLSKSPKEINSKTIEKPQRVQSQSIAETPLLPPDFLLPQDMPQNTSLSKDISLQQKITSQQNTKAYNDWLNQQMQDNQRNQQMLNAFDKYMNKGK